MVTVSLFVENVRDDGECGVLSVCSTAALSAALCLCCVLCTLCCVYFVQNNNACRDLGPTAVGEKRPLLYTE